MNKLFLTVLLLTVSSSAIFSQSPQKNKENNPTLQQAIDALEGTYEIRLRIETRMMSALPSNLAQTIEANRKESEDVFVHLNDMVDVLIYSRQRIQSKK